MNLPSKLFLIGTMAFSFVAQAQDIDLAGNTGWSKRGNRINIHAEEITNNRSEDSGYLRLQIWATTNVYGGTGTISGYVLGTYNLGPLPAGFSFLNKSRTVRYHRPPAGLYYTTITLEENTTEGFVIVDSENFDGLVNLGGFGAGAVNVGLNGDITFAGDVTWLAGDGHVEISAEQIINQRSSGRSGTLRVRLFATADPYDGGPVLEGYPMATKRAGRVFAQSDISFFGRTHFRPPPSGDYNVVMTLEEYFHGWNIVDYINFPDRSLF